MKFSCEKCLLQTAINTASRAAAAKSPIPALEGLLIQADIGVKITGYDLKKGIYTSFPADVSEPGASVLNARLLGEIIRSLPEGIVTISLDKGTLVSIKCGKSEFSIMGTSANDYPEVQEVNGSYSLCLPQKKFKSMINQTIFALSNNESRPVYTGSLIEISEGIINVISVDGYRLALRREKLDNGDAKENSFIVPGSTLSDVEKICTETEEEVKITVSDKQVGFIIGDTVIISRRLEGDFLNYRKSVPTSFNTLITVERSQLQRVVDRVSLIIDDKIKSPLRCTFSPETVELVCVTSLGRAEDSLQVTGEGAPVEIGFNNRYLLDALKAAPSEKVRICLGTGTSPCVIIPDDGSESFLYMILPVRLKAGD